MAIHTIAPGETLSGIAQKYGMDWREVWKANPNVKNPDMIYAGQPLTIPDKGTIETPAGSLEKTLPSATPAAQSPSLLGATPDLTGNQLPAAGGLDQMTLLRRILANMGTNYTASGMKGGLQATMSGLESSAGFAPEKVSGNMVGSIIDFVEGQVKNPIEKEVNTFADTIDSIAKMNSYLEDRREKVADNARQMISQAISGNMWNAMDDNQRKSLWQAAGYEGTPILSKDEKKTTIVEVGGRKILIDSQTGERISDLGSSGSIPVGTIKSGGLAISGNDVAGGQAKLNQSRGTDGYSDTNTYISMFNLWLQNGGLADDFFKYYSPTDYVNPDDASIPAYIRNKIKKQSGSSNELDDLTKALGIE
jgi:LysM repeat protein